jgi:hypothetical protein
VSYISPEPDWRRPIITLEVVIILGWGGAFLAIGNALSGPYSMSEWTGMAAIWLVPPLLVTALFSWFAKKLIKIGKHRAGMIVVSLPLVLLGLVAFWALFFG